MKKLFFCSVLLLVAFCLYAGGDAEGGDTGGGSQQGSGPYDGESIVNFTYDGPEGMSVELYRDNASSGVKIGSGKSYSMTVSDGSHTFKAQPVIGDSAAAEDGYSTSTDPQSLEEARWRLNHPGQTYPASNKTSFKKAPSLIASEKTIISNKNSTSINIVVRRIRTAVVVQDFLTTSTVAITTKPRASAAQANQQTQTPQVIVPVAPNDDDFIITQLTDGTLRITGYRGSLNDIIIPATISGVAVSEIGPSAFANRVSSLHSVVISPGIKSIGNWAFYTSDNNGGIVDVTIPNTVTRIGKRAFAANKLTRVTIPSSVTIISEESFRQNNLTSVTLPSSVTTIESAAFANNYLTSITLPPSIKTIGLSAFASNYLTSITFPASVREVDNHVFSENPVEFVALEAPPESFKAPSVYMNSLNFIGSTADFRGITLGANFPDGTLSMIGLPQGFRNFYISQERKGGTYIKKGQIWTLGTPQELQQLMAVAQRAAVEKATAASTAKQSGLRKVGYADNPRGTQGGK
jgi:hypothetical protein